MMDTRRLIVGAAIAIAAACGGGTPAPEAQKAKEPERPTVGFLLDTTHERWQRDRDLFTERAEALGVRVDVRAGEGSHEAQVKLANDLLAAGIKVLVIVANDADRAGEIVAAAKAKNVPVIAYDRLIRNADIDLYVTFDTEKVGEMQAQYLLNRAPKGNYILIGGSPTDDNTQHFRAGQMKVLGPAVKSRAIRVVADEYATNWSAEEAEKITLAGLDKARNSVAAVVASNDATAGGAIKALESRGLAGKVLVSGQDAELDAARRIVAGTQAMTVYKPLGSLTRLAARAAVQLANGEPVDTVATTDNGQKQVPTMLLEPITVDKGNLDAVLIGDGFLSKDDVYASAAPK
jgi:D-xylose transport system substrate-binding protein